MSDSGIYRGEVMHQRLRPRRHRFRYRVDAFLLDLDELAGLAQRCRWFSLNRFNLFSFHDRDVGDGSGTRPRQYLEAVLRQHGIEQRPANAQLLCYPRILGFAFNPLTVYYCHDEAERLFAVLCEVNNTFGQRHSYLLPLDQPVAPGGIARQHCDKHLYVSPFMAMEQHYHFRLRAPDEKLLVAIRQTERGRPMLNALFQGQRRPLTDGALLQCFFGLPWMTVKVVAAIHWQALRLWFKGLRPIPRPTAPRQAVTVPPVRSRFSRQANPDRKPHHEIRKHTPH